MSLGRHGVRECAVKVIFGWIQTGNYSSKEIALDTFSPNERDLDFLESIVNGVKEKFDDLKSKISGQSLERPWDDIPVVVRTILLIAYWEILYGNTPKSIAMNEAIENAKTFADEGSARFVNGVLSKINTPDYEDEDIST